MNKLEKTLIVGSFIFMTSALISTFSDKTEKYILPLLYSGIGCTTASLSKNVYNELIDKSNYQKNQRIIKE